MLPPEDDNGNIEYKLRITTKCNKRIEQLATQMKWRLNEGNGYAEYLIGVEDDGNIKNISSKDYNMSLKNIIKIIDIIDAKIIDNSKIEVNDDFYYYKIKISADKSDNNSSRIILIGPSNSGKSTIVGNLLKNLNDNGKGKSRTFVFNHKHEIYSGETSSISIKNIKKTFDKISYNINLIDTPGKKKYQKTMISSLCKYRPNLVLLVIDPIEIDIKSLTQYLEILKYFKFPFYIIFTKFDKYDKFHKNYLIKNILEICKKDYDNDNIKKVPYVEISNINRDGYNKLNNIIKNYCCNPSRLYGNIYDNNFLCNSKFINIQICDVLNVPNMSRIYTGLTLNNVNTNNTYSLISPTFEKNNIKINTLYFLDKPYSKIDIGNLVTFTLNNDIDFDNKSDILLTNQQITKSNKINVKYNKKINNSQGICIYNNQYIVVKIINNNNNTYTLINIDNSYFINLSNKIIIKVDNIFHFTNLIESNDL